MRRKRLMVSIFILALCFTAANGLGPGGIDMETLFPQIEGMKKKGSPDIYTPDNLYEYINGAADLFLSYDFQRLAALTYEDEQNHSLTIDIYRHSSENNGFGIYSAEKPQQGDFLAIGAEGYYEQGVLNFFNGRFYVKMSGFDLGAKDNIIMTAAAKEIAARLGGKVELPIPVACFPKKGLIKHSVKYIAVDFLGHSFLHSAFAAEYKDGGGEFKVFIIEAADAKGAAGILENYLAFARGKGSQVSQAKGYHSFLDPYYRSSGKMNMKVKGKYAWGLFGDDEARAAYFMKEIEDNLERVLK